MRIWVCKLLVATLAIVVLTAGSWAQQMPSNLRNLIYVMAYPPVTLDPANSEDSGSPHVIIHVTEPLIMVGSDNKLRPHLAVSWKANADATVWTVKLRQGVKFSDGTPFNAQAVKFNFDRLVDPKAPTKQAGRADNIKAVEVVDEYTVNYIMRGPYSELPFLLAQTYLFIVSPKAARELGPDIASKAVGTGPFKVERFVSNEGAVLVRNPNYWGEMGNIGRLEIKRVSEYTTRRLMLENGEAHVIMNVIPEDIEALSKVRGVKVHQRSSTRQYMVSMNVLVRPFDNRRVRQALNYAVHKERMVTYMFRGTATVNDSSVPPSVEGYVPLKAYPYDPAKAKQLLSEAGYPDGFKANIWGPTAGRILMGSETVEQVQADLSKVGVHLTITEADAAAQIRRITLPPKQSEEAGKHLMFLGGPAARGIQIFFEDFFSTASWTPKGSNRGFYSHARVDALVKMAGQTGDPAKRQAIYADIQRILWDDAPWIFLYTVSLLWGYSDKVEGLEFMPNDLVLLTKAKIR
jgi:glutathione transport system substrate-binding protein